MNKDVFMQALIDGTLSGKYEWEVTGDHLYALTGLNGYGVVLQCQCRSHTVSRLKVYIKEKEVHSWGTGEFANITCSPSGLSRVVLERFPYQGDALGEIIKQLNSSREVA